MSAKNFPPFLKWGDYQSTNPDKPDILELEIIDPEPFETQYDWNVLAKVNGAEINIPLRGKTANKNLYKQYVQNLQRGKIQSGTKMIIKTCLGKSSKHPNYDLRDFIVVV